MRGSDKMCNQISAIEIRLEQRPKPRPLAGASSILVTPSRHTAFPEDLALLQEMFLRLGVQGTSACTVLVRKGKHIAIEFAHSCRPTVVSSQSKTEEH